jgi:hypothetical protein
MIKLIVGLSGKKGSGKDTVAKAMADHLARRAMAGGPKLRTGIHPMAGPMKAICVNFFGLPERAVYGDDAAKGLVTDYRWENLPHYREMEDDYNYSAEGWASEPPTGFMTVRDFLQHFGTEVARRMNPRVHIDANFREIDRAGADVAFVPDVRFPGEVEAIQARGGKVIRLTRAPRSDTHESETALDPIRFNWSQFDEVVDNDKMTLAETIRRAEELIDQWT